MTRSSARAAGVVGVSVVLSGLLVNLYLVVVARNLDPQDYLYFSAFWSLALVSGFGVYLPVEQELARRIHTTALTRRALGQGALAAAVVLVLELIVVVAASVWLDDAMGHRLAALAALGGLCLVSAPQFVVRGALIGADRMTAYAMLLLGDSALRVALAAALGFSGSHDAPAYSFVIVVSIGVTHLPVLAQLARRSGVGPALADQAPAEPAVADQATASRRPDRRIVATIGPLLVGSLAAQLLLNGLPVMVAATASASERVAAGQFTASFQLARVPLFVAVPLQTTILPTLTRLFGAADARQLTRTFTRFVGAIIGLAGCGVLVSVAIGPQLASAVFGSDYRADRLGLAILSVGVAAYLGLLVTTQALVVVDQHRDVALAWLAGVLVGLIIFLSLPDLVRAAETAFAVGSVAGWAVGVGLLARRIGQHRSSVPGTETREDRISL